MASLDLHDDVFVVRLSPWEKIGALRGDLRVPRTSIASVHRVQNARASARGLRAPGTGVPGLVSLGTWRGRRGKDFVAAYRRRPGVVIELGDQRYDRIVISGPCPEWLREWVTD